MKPAMVVLVTIAPPKMNKAILLMSSSIIPAIMTPANTNFDISRKYEPNSLYKFVFPFFHIANIHFNFHCYTLFEMAVLGQS